MNNFDKQGILIHFIKKLNNEDKDEPAKLIIL